MKCRLVLLSCWVLLLSAAVRGFGQDVVISEIMYRPQTSGAGLEEEWIELHNRGATEVNLLGWRFQEGVDLTFTNEVILPPGGYWVICADRQRFQTRYPLVANVTGNWSGFLNNNGEDIVLVDTLSQEVDRVEYATEGEWAIRRR